MTKFDSFTSRALQDAVAVLSLYDQQACVSTVLRDVRKHLHQTVQVTQPVTTTKKTANKAKNICPVCGSQIRLVTCAKSIFMGMYKCVKCEHVKESR